MTANQPTSRAVLRSTFPAEGTYRVAPADILPRRAGAPYRPRHLAPRHILLSTVASCIILVGAALNLRPAVTSVGSLLAEIVAGTGMSDTASSVVVAAPLACFAIGSLLACPLQAWLGCNRTILTALATLALALISRVSDGPVVMLAGTILGCLAIAVLSTVIPVIVRAAPASRFTVLTTCWTTAMGFGSGLGAFVTPHLSAAWSWRFAAGSWGLLAAASYLAWLVFGRRIAPPELISARAPRVNPFRLTPASTAWALTVHLGMVAAFTFTCMGWLPQILLAADVAHASTDRLFTVAMALGIFVAPFVPRLAKRPGAQPFLAVLLAAPGMFAVAGFLLVPGVAPWLWSCLLGLAMVAIVPALALIGIRAADTAATAGLSSLVLGVGFAIAAVVSFGLGEVHTLTHSWQWPLCAMLAVQSVQVVTGILAARPLLVRAR